MRKTTQGLGQAKKQRGKGEKIRESREEGSPIPPVEPWVKFSLYSESLDCRLGGPIRRLPNLRGYFDMQLKPPLSVLNRCLRMEPD
jgi:hypothetical protein